MVNLTETQILKTFHCQVYPEGKINYVDLSIELNRNVSDIRVNLLFDMLRKNNAPINLLKTDITACEFLDNSENKYIKIINVLRKEFRKVSNLRCPFVEVGYFIICRNKFIKFFLHLE